MCECISSTPPLSSSLRLSHLSSTQPFPHHFGIISHPPGASLRNLSLFTTKLIRKTPILAAQLGYKEVQPEEEEEEEEDHFDFDPTIQNHDQKYPTGLDILQIKNKNKNKNKKKSKDSVIEDSRKLIGKVGLRRGRQIIRRSHMFAKQVISIQSALTLGFVSQIWVDTASWRVLIVEVRPNLLSGESERFPLDSVEQVGDVVLVEDENVLDNELKMVGLETLVGYQVVTPSRQYIGKVRGYSFNINSGAVELLELDSFGISIIPSSLVSTYALPVDDVLEVLSDTVIVHEAAGSQIQRLTKGFWDPRNLRTSIDEMEEYSDSEIPNRLDDRGKLGRKIRNFDNDDWELPMDYL
ncbi:hypothetical protein M5689_009580 [Euphorbia peplus]|nr:hypothetical protein M5689_009580 [Euphorbia peplus]